MKELLLRIINVSIEAGKEILKIYESNDFGISLKSDNSPLTNADKASNETIINVLEELKYPIISEENKQIDYEIRKHWSKFWLVDPLDGTKEFIKKNGQFTVNVALIENFLPVLGVIYIPVEKKIYFGMKDFGSFMIFDIDSEINSVEELLNLSKKIPLEKENRFYRAIVSRSHYSDETKEYIDHLKENHPDLEQISFGSSLKFCKIAQGQADIYPRFGPTMEWDIAAGHAIVKFAGGSVKKIDTNEEMTYNKESLLNPFFVVSNN